MTPELARTVHFPRNRKLMLIVGVWLLVVAIGVALMPATNPNVPERTILQRLSYAAIPGFIGLIALAFALFQKIVTTAQFFEFHTFGTVIRTPWSNVRRIGPHETVNQITVLYLSEEVDVHTGWLSKRQQHKTITIPLQGYDLREGSQLEVAFKRFLNP